MRDDLGWHSTGPYSFIHSSARGFGGEHRRSAKAAGEGRRSEEAQGERPRDPVARHPQPGRLGGLHRERHEVAATDPRRSHLGAAAQATPRPHRAIAQAGGREAGEGLTGPGQRLGGVSSAGGSSGTPHSTVTPKAGPPLAFWSSNGIRVAVHPLRPHRMPEVFDVLTVWVAPLRKAGA